jgi:signal transduction histidine kinase
MRQIPWRLDAHASPPERAQAECDLAQTAHQVAEVAVLNERQRLARELHDVMLSVIDDGRGFDPDETHPGHFGVQLMCEQALAVGATLDVVTGPSRGTQVRVRVGRRRR